MKYQGITIRQYKGKYGRFDCPKCGTEDQYWKFSANHGFCEKCDAIYQALTVIHSIGDPTEKDHKCTIEELF